MHFIFKSTWAKNNSKCYKKKWIIVPMSTNRPKAWKWYDFSFLCLFWTIPEVFLTQTKQPLSHCVGLLAGLLVGLSVGPVTLLFFAILSCLKVFKFKYEYFMDVNAPAQLITAPAQLITAPAQRSALFFNDLLFPFILQKWWGRQGTRDWPWPWPF